MRCFIAILLLSGFAQAQPLDRNRITLSGGWMTRVGEDYNPQSAPVVGVSYGYRALKFLELDAGLHVALQPGQELCSRFGCYDPNDRYFWIMVGARLVAPLVAGRVELSLGGGGLVQQYSVSNRDSPFGVSSQGAFGGYFTAGAAAPLDRRHHFWIGVTPRVLLANPEFGRDRWFTITGDVSYRF